MSFTRFRWCTEIGPNKRRFISDHQCNDITTLPALINGKICNLIALKVDVVVGVFSALENNKWLLWILSRTFFQEISKPFFRLYRPFNKYRWKSNTKAVVKWTSSCTLNALLNSKWLLKNFMSYLHELKLRCMSSRQTAMEIWSKRKQIRQRQSAKSTTPTSFLKNIDDFLGSINRTKKGVSEMCIFCTSVELGDFHIQSLPTPIKSLLASN